MFLWRICPTFSPTLTVRCCVPLCVYEHVCFCVCVCVIVCVIVCRRSLRPVLTVLPCVCQWSHPLASRSLVPRCLGGEECVYSQMTHSLSSAIPTSLLLSLPSSSKSLDVECFITFGPKSVSDSITQPDCDVTRWGRIVTIDTKHTH